jgi:ankyrin repeat protein
VVSDRLRAGYISAACNGDLEQAQLLAQLEVPQPLDQARLLACAACSGERATVDWLLAAQPDLRADQVVIATDGDSRRPRTALSCAARANDLVLARLLLQRGAVPRDLEGAASSIAIAASRQHWDMVRLLLQRDRAAASIAAFAAMDGAYARDAHRPAEVLDKLLATGVPALVVDRQGRNLFHWAGMRHDLKLAQLLLQRSGNATADQTLAHADRQGALPWMYVLRRAELTGQPLSEDATALLRLLLPPGADLEVALKKPLEPGAGDAFPTDWSAAKATIHQPAAREVLGLAPDADAPTDQRP